jgi:4-hydroxyphenylacetate decarboxylase large subunit
MGGLTKDGQSAVNRLEYLIVISGMTCETPQPTLSVLYDEKLPEEFLLQAVESIKTGTGYPAWMNNRLAMEFLLNQYGSEGMTVEEARAVAIGGCLETSPCSWHELNLNGKTYVIPGGSGQPTSVGVHFIANPKVLELVLFNGYDYRTKSQVLPPHNKGLSTYEELWETFKEYYEIIVDCLAKCNNIQHDIWRKQNMSVFNSMLKPDCLKKGHHIGNLGYRYNGTFNIESCGQISAINSMASLKKLVYDDKKYSLDEIKDGILNNFGFIPAGETGNFSIFSQVKRQGNNGKYDRLYQDCLNSPKFGNDNPSVDELFREYELWFCAMCRNYESLYGKKNVFLSDICFHPWSTGCNNPCFCRRTSLRHYLCRRFCIRLSRHRQKRYLCLFESATCWDHSQYTEFTAESEAPPYCRKRKRRRKKNSWN